MWKSITGRITLIAVLAVISIIILVPSLTDRVPAGWKDRVPKINLGLDLQGGVFLRLAVDINKAIENTSMRYADDARAICREKALPVLSVQKAGDGGFSLRFPPGDFATRAQATLKEELPSLDVSLGEVKADGATVIARMKPAEIQAIRTNAVVQGVETIRNRIDQFGVREPQIVAEGDDRIVVQLPGVKDQQRAIELVGKTALLEFKLVDEGASLEEALKGNVPEDDQLLYQKVGRRADRQGDEDTDPRKEAGAAHRRHDQDGEGELQQPGGGCARIPILRYPGGQDLRPGDRRERQAPPGDRP